MSVAWVGLAVTAATAVSQGMAAEDAEDAQYAATQAAQKETRDARQSAEAAQAPFLQGGANATNRLQELLGLGGDKGAAGYGSLNNKFSFTPGDLTQTPGYQFTQQQGQNALDRKAAAGGGFYSGAGLQAASAFNQDLAGTTYDKEYNRAFNAYQTDRTNTLNPLQALAGQGQSAANTTGQIQLGSANSLAGLMTAQGNATGAAGIAQGNALSNGLNNGLTAWQRANMLNQQNQQSGQQWWASGQAGGNSSPSSFGTSGLNGFFYGNGTSGD